MTRTVVRFPPRRKPRAGQDRDFNLRFGTSDEYELVKKAAAARGLSTNRFIAETIVAAAGRVLRKAS